MIDERTEAQASLYVLGALPPDEAREFETAMRADLQLQLLVKELRGTAGTMVAAFPQVSPPPGLKEKILAAIGDDKTAATVVPLEERRGADWTAWMPWALAACFAILCVVLISIGQSLRQQSVSLREQLQQKKTEADDLRYQIELLEGQSAQVVTNYQQRIREVERLAVQRIAELSRQYAAASNDFQRQQGELQRQMVVYRTELERLKGDGQPQPTDGVTSPQQDPNATRLASLRPTANGPPRASGASYWDPQQQRGQLVVDNLPVLSSTQDYQFWLIDSKSGSPISGGVFSVDASGSARVLLAVGVRVESTSSFAITVERKGGSGTPTLPIILSSN